MSAPIASLLVVPTAAEIRAQIIREIARDYSIFALAALVNKPRRWTR